MPRQVSQGTCNLCTNKFTKAAMARHLVKCQQEQRKSSRAKSGTPKRIFHLLVEGVPFAYYWMHLEIPADALLHDLDDFLRRTWLECCGHLSAFMITGQRYSVMPVDDTIDTFWTKGFHEEDFNHALGSILKPGMKFKHEYDFGTTTELALRVISEREGISKRRAVTVLARNDPPEIKCEKCKKKPATRVCSICIYHEKAWYCDNCFSNHKCYQKGEDYFLPVVNSPRVGQCGYTGEPY